MIFDDIFLDWLGIIFVSFALMFLLLGIGYGMKFIFVLGIFVMIWGKLGIVCFFVEIEFIEFNIIFGFLENVVFFLFVEVVCIVFLGI